MNRKNKSAFTLVELAIVLVIIGLLVGGVLQGQELIKQAQYRNQIQNIISIQTAHNTFKLKYNCISGDCKNSTTFFPSVTANGDGDKKVQCWNPPYPNECDVYFYTLVQASLINNTDLNGGVAQIYGYKGTLNNSIMYVHYKDRYNGISGNPESSVYLHLISRFTGAATVAIFTPEDSQQLDLKFDDGKAATGVFYGINGYSSTYTLLTCLSSNDYDLTQTGTNCRVDYKIE